MSSASVASNKHEDVSEMTQEINSIKAMNSSLKTYLDHLRAFKKNLIGMNGNFSQLNKVNKQWVDTLNSK